MEGESGGGGGVSLRFALRLRRASKSELLCNLAATLEASSPPPSIFDGTTRLYTSYTCPLALLREENRLGRGCFGGCVLLFGHCNDETMFRGRQFAPNSGSFSLFVKIGWTLTLVLQRVLISLQYPLSYQLSDIAFIAKIESIDSLTNLDEIVQASDGAMMARGDLGAQIPLEEVPSIQQKIVQKCRDLNKPVIVASQLLESMIEYPTPTRAEVADVSEAVRQRADALMLSGESAMSLFPEKALAVLRSVSVRIEQWWREEKNYEPVSLPSLPSSFTGIISEGICNSAANMDE